MRSYTTLTEEKATWGPGPWQDEPDKIQWVDEASGLDCLVVRNEWSGHWCGYVGVPETHPWYGVPYQDLDDGLDVHGGLTFSDSCSEDDAADPSRGICHVPEPGRSERPWWLGFDCHHFQDFAPGFAARERERTAHKQGTLQEHFPVTYRRLAYVQAECSRLAAQAQEAAR